MIVDRIKCRKTFLVKISDLVTPQQKEFAASHGNLTGHGYYSIPYDEDGLGRYESRGYWCFSDVWHYQSWQEREQSRFDDGEYKKLPIMGLSFPIEHYLHRAVKASSPEMVAYTPSAEYGKADRQISIKFGKYLRKIFPHYADHVIQDYVVRLRTAIDRMENGKAYTLHFTTERETINTIFETEMCACDSRSVSCMHGKFTDWTNRPYHVYADSPDVAVAYIVHATEGIVARSVISTKNQTYVRLYGVNGEECYCQNLKVLLQEQGYTQGNLTGNKLTMLPEEHGRVILPYIDHGGMGVNQSGNYWIVCEESDGEYVGCETTGYADAKDKCGGCNRSQDNCECIYCGCCEERYADGCDSCSMCEHCDRCLEHERCTCERCDNCSARTRDCDCIYCACCNRSYDSDGCPLCNNCVECSECITHDNCTCERCTVCRELTDECGCDRCEFCNALTDECECILCDECQHPPDACICPFHGITDNEIQLSLLEDK